MRKIYNKPNIVFILSMKIKNNLVPIRCFLHDLVKNKIMDLPNSSMFIFSFTHFSHKFPLQSNYLYATNSKVSFLPLTLVISTTYEIY